MRLRLFLLACCFIFSAALRADTSDGWQFQVPAGLDLPAPVLESSSLGTLDQSPSGGEEVSEEPPAPGRMAFSASSSSSAGNVADEITPEIQNLAASLQNDPTRIFEFVYNAIEYEHYYGSKKGAHLTLLEGSGNDMDQSALLVALYRAAGYTATYQSRWTLLPYDETVPPYNVYNPEVLYTGVNWLGLDAAPYPGLTITRPGYAASWTDLEYKKTLLLLNYFYYSGFRVYVVPEYPGALLVPHMVVKVTAGGLTFTQDPSAKRLTGKAAVNFITATGFNSTTKAAFLTALGGTATGTYVSSLDTTGPLAGTIIRQQISNRTATFNAYLRANRPNDSVRDILGRKENQTLNFSGLQGWSYLLFVTGGIDYAPVDFPVIPESAMSSLEIQIDANTAYSTKMPALQGKRLSATATGDLVEIRLNEDVIHSATVGAATYSLKLAAKHPHISYLSTVAADTTKPFHDKDDGGKTYKKSGSYALIYA
ncbi:MAG: hypothetical protein RIQ79_899, partial [Verrucomicrobiota bacterium]